MMINRRPRPSGKVVTSNGGELSAFSFQIVCKYCCLGFKIGSRGIAVALSFRGTFLYFFSKPFKDDMMMGREGVKSRIDNGRQRFFFFPPPNDQCE